MSYNLFLLLNPNHEKEGLIQFLTEHLENSGIDRFCFDQSPDIYFSLEYMKEGNDTSLAIDIPFGAEEQVIKEVFDFMTELQTYIQFQVLDPQIGTIIESENTRQIMESWKENNREALESYRDGHHFLRSMDEREGQKMMIEAIRFKEETWQNHCSVGMAFNRVQDADQALKHFQRALDLDPDNPGIWHALGVTLFNLRRYPEAIQYFSRYLQLDPDNPTANELLQISNERTGTTGN